MSNQTLLAWPGPRSPDKFESRRSQALEGTSIRQASIDLSASTGGANGLPDAVTVNGTNQADKIDVAARDSQVSVKGLQAETRVTGSDPFDHLQINTVDGNDKVTVDPNVPPLIGLGVDLGLGQV